MRQLFNGAAFAFAMAALAACSGGPASMTAAGPNAAAGSTAQTQISGAPNGNAFGYFAQRVCGAVAPGAARCHALLRVDAAGNAAAAAPAGYGPADLQAAYKLNVAGGAGQTVAVVDAYDQPNIESDLAVYRAQFGLPPCTTANGCFRKVDQNGGTAYPRANASWGQETSLDVDMVSANCPNCHILVVETNSNQLADLGSGVNTAARLGANAISNSYGGSESASETTSEATYYQHPGIAVTASSGDSGYGPQFPAASQYVTATGGTSLTTAANARGWSETVWSGAGSGCSAYITKPAWQSDPLCAKRTIADVAYDADPNTGVAVYDSYGHHNQVGWLVFGGTSVASPAIAAIYALAGNAAGVTYGSSSYSHTAALFDVTSGSNGSCGGTYLCTGTAGYDGPTGNGTPNGTAGF